MPAVKKRTISITVDQLVAAGRNASASEVIRSGQRALQERDGAIERWLHTEVAPVADAMRPPRAVPSPPTPQALPWPSIKPKSAGGPATYGAER